MIGLDKVVFKTSMSAEIFGNQSGCVSSFESIRDGEQYLTQTEDQASKSGFFSPAFREVSCVTKKKDVCVWLLDKETPEVRVREQENKKEVLEVVCLQVRQECQKTCPFLKLGESTGRMVEFFPPDCVWGKDAKSKKMREKLKKNTGRPFSFQKVLGEVS